eukprot:350556-Chlamydomonas_euryale.AAC.23
MPHTLRPAGRSTQASWQGCWRPEDPAAFEIALLPGSCWISPALDRDTACRCTGPAHATCPNNASHGPTSHGPTSHGPTLPHHTPTCLAALAAELDAHLPRVSTPQVHTICSACNCNQAIDICRRWQLQLVNIGGLDIARGARGATMTVVWQVRAAPGSGPILNSVHPASHVRATVTAEWQARTTPDPRCVRLFKPHTK